MRHTALNPMIFAGDHPLDLSDDREAPVTHTQVTTEEESSTRRWTYIEVYKRRLKRAKRLIERLERRSPDLVLRAEALVARLQAQLDEALEGSTEREEIMSYFLFIANRDERERRQKILRENAAARADGCPPWLLHPVDWK